MTEIQSEINNKRDSSRTYSQDIQSLHKKLEQIDNIKNRRLDNLRNNRNKDLYNAIIWLRENKHHFKEEVFEPPAVTVSIKK